MHTVLLWGDRWWLPGRNEPVAFAALVEAAEALAAAWPKSDERRLRLVYQPESFTTSAVTCPNGNRRTLALALAEEHPALAQADQAWGHEPILPAADGFTTLLHCESAPGLFALVERLTGLGFAAESAVPAVTWLQALPTERSDSGAFAIVLAGREQACGFFHDAAGERRAPVWTSPAAVASFVREFLAQDSGASVLLVVADDETAAALDTGFGAEPPAGLEGVRVGEALRRPATVPRHHPAQLLPPAPFIAPSRVVVAASVAFLLIAAVAAANYTRDYLRWREASSTHEAQHEALRTEVAHLRANAEEIATLRAELAADQRRPPVSAFLERLSATVPPEIMLGALKITPARFTAAGWAAPTLGNANWEAWISRLGASAPWQMAPARPAADGAFHLEGKFP